MSGGFIGQLVDSFTGKGAEDKLDQGIGAVGAGRDSAIGAYKQYGDQSQGAISPFANGGKGASLYADTTGANGADAMRRSQDLWLKNNPMLAFQLKQQAQRDNSGGGGPTTALGVLGANRVAEQNFGTFQNALANESNNERNAGTTSAQLYGQTGGQVGGAYTGAASQTADLYGKEATNSNTMAQNFIGAGAVLGSLATGVPIPTSYGRNNLGSQPSQPYPQQPGYPYSGVSTRQS